MVVTGDATQVDLPPKQSSVWLKQKILSSVNGIHFHEFDHDDGSTSTRKLIISAYEQPNS